MSIHDRIPNNVDLSEDRKLQRALESWQPDFIDWWRDMGPDGFQEDQVYLRTAISVEEGGWANFSYVKMPDYRWGIFLAPPQKDRTIPFGDRLGEPTWDRVPGDLRKELRRIIVTQGDTEPASVEQQRLLGHSAPSLYDLRNLFQVNVEEARHLWAMVYLLHRYFGRDGRDEAAEMLERRAGDQDSPRILEAFNKPCADWLAFFCFTMFMDRDGKFQLAALAESAFEPLSRSTRFMLTEEAHHLFVGETGIGRIVRRTAELMTEAPAEDVTRRGGIPLDVIQRYVNEWFTASLDLFGSEDSSNAATWFATGLKGRFKESSSRRYDDHVALDHPYVLDAIGDRGQLSSREIPMRRAMNAVLRDAYVEDCARAVRRWNSILDEEGISERLFLPSDRFGRRQGLHANLPFDPSGTLRTPAEIEARRADWLPTQADRDYVASVMVPELRPGRFASWIAPPSKGIGGQDLDFEYVKRAG